MSAAYRGLRANGLRGNRSLLPRKTDDTVDGRRRNGERAATRWRCRGWAVVLIQGEAPAAPGAVPRSRAGSGTWSLLRLSRAHFVEREREPVGAIAVSKCDMPAQLANESFRADHVRFGNSVGAVVQVLMRSDIPAAEAFFRDHLRTSPYRSGNFGGHAVGCARRRGWLASKRSQEPKGIRRFVSPFRSTASGSASRCRYF
jgi:hypothetical protein